MKKLSVLTAIIMTVSLAACASEAPSSEKVSSESETVPVTTVQEISSHEDKPAEDQRSAALGTWILDHDGLYVEVTFASPTEEYIRNSLNINHDFYFDKDLNFVSNGRKASKDEYTFKDGVFSFSYNGKCVLEMKKVDGNDELFGEYLLTGGDYLDLYIESNEEDGRTVFLTDSINIIVAENDTTLYATTPIENFELKEDTIIHREDKTGKIVESHYRVEGDTLTITSSQGEESTLTRKK